MSEDHGKEIQIVIQGREFSVIRRLEQFDKGLVWLDVKKKKNIDVN